MNTLLFYVWLMFNVIFSFDNQVTPIIPCRPELQLNTQYCSAAGYALPGYPTRATWTRQEDTPLIFYGRAIRYDHGLMRATAIKRGFDESYLQEFDCLVSGFFINDVGRVAWMLHKGDTYRCLVVDNAWPRDIYNPVINSREAVEVSYTFSRDVLGSNTPQSENPIVVMAYQVEEPTPEEWASAQRLDQWLFDNWITSYHGEPHGYIQIKKDMQTWYMIDEDYKEWKPIPGCLYCDESVVTGFTDEIIEYVVVPGDSLNIISKKVYGYSHPRFWEAIVQANPDIIEDPTYLLPGMVLKIPVWGELPAVTIRK